MLALKVMSKITIFRMRHRPHQLLRLRICCHCGKPFVIVFSPTDNVFVSFYLGMDQLQRCNAADIKPKFHVDHGKSHLLSGSMNPDFYLSETEKYLKCSRKMEDRYFSQKYFVSH